jgi:arsenite-transporting ATPase
VRVILHTGKGGVGKTSLSIATALGAAQHGHRVFLLSTDSAHNLGDALGRPVGPRPVEVAEHVVAQEVDALTELDRSWSSIQDWLRELLRSDTDDMVAEELLVFPGMEELVALRAVRAVEETGEFDVCVVDCAPTGSTLRMLRFPDVLRIFMNNFFDWKRKAAKLIRPVAATVGAEIFVPSDEVFAAFERLYLDVEDVREILLDTDRTSARLVINPAGVVVDETRRSFAYLSLYGVATDAVLVNRVLPPEATVGYFARWAQRERLELEEIEQSFPVPRFHAPLHSEEPIGVGALRDLAIETYGERDPAEVFTRTRPIRLTKRANGTVMEIDLVSAASEDLDVAVRGDQLFVRVRDARRRIALPDSVAGRAIVSARLNEGVLEVAFEE